MFLMALLSASASGAATPGQNGLIAFGRDGVIYLAKTDRSDPVRLVLRDESGAPVPAGTLRARDPVWSPSGDKIAFTGALATAGNTRNHDIYVSDPDGSQLTRLTRAAAQDDQPVWSPDGSMIAFRSDRRKQHAYDIYTMNADRSGIAPLAQDGVSPSWSPDGGTISFHRFDPSASNWTTYFASPDGTTPQLVPSLAGISTGLDWSPDGSRVAYTTIVPDQGWHLFTAAPDGSDKKQLTRTLKPPVFDGIIGPGEAVATRSLASKPSAGANFDPTWSPDGRQIAFSTGSDFAPPGMYVMGADGKGTWEIVAPELAGGSLSWQPLPITGELEPEPPATNDATTPPTTNSAPTTRNSKCTIVGTPGDDVLIGTPGRDVICGLAGDDIIRGLAGNDVIKAGPGDDVVKGGKGKDRIHGQAGEDELFGQRGPDIIKAGPGDDELKGGPGRDKLFGQTGDDTFFIKKGGRDIAKGGAGHDEARYDKTLDRIRSIETTI